MRNINLRYVDETYDENGLLETYKIKYPETYNFGYDVVDDIAINAQNIMTIPFLRVVYNSPTWSI